MLKRPWTGVMQCLRAGAATVVWISVALGMSACSGMIDLQALVGAPPAPQPEPATPSPPPSRPVDASDPNQVRLEIVRYFWKLKYPRPQYEALVDHARDESGFRPCAMNGSSLRYLYQWGGLRLQRLQAYARTNDCPSLEKQLAFTNYELRHEGNYGCFWEAQTRETALRTLRRGFGQGRC